MKFFHYIKQGNALTIAIIGLSFMFPGSSYANTLDEGIWRLQSGLEPSLVPSTEITAEFNNGKLTGSGGCNRYIANYNVKPKSETSGKIWIEVIGSTRRFCGEAINAQETKYFQVLKNVRNYRVTDKGLVLNNRSSRSFLLFTQKQALNLPQQVADAILKAAQELTGEEGLVIAEFEQQTWPNSCLGLPEPDQICADSLVPGYRVVVEVSGGKGLIYRTNLSGSQIRLEKEGEV